MISNTLMTSVGSSLTRDHLDELIIAINYLENPNFATKLANYTGRPVTAAIKYMPKWINRRLRNTLRVVILKCLEVSIESLEDENEAFTSHEWTAKIITGFTGGIGGFFGMSAVLIELPLTTTLMLRSIAEIARTEGENLKNIEALLACLEVFALGGRDSDDKVNEDYYAVRMVLTKLTNEVATLFLERGAVNVSSPIIARLVGEIVGRFGLVVTDMSASSAVPVLGAFFGSAVNIVFMDHFQKIAHGHFIIRRLERIYGADAIKNHYTRQVQKSHELDLKDLNHIVKNHG